MELAVAIRGELQIASIPRALRKGWDCFVSSRAASVSYAMIFAALGLATLFLVDYSQVAPMAIAIAGGFMLIGPILLLGYFNLADEMARGTAPALGLALAGFGKAPPAVWVMAAICTFFYLIWITDAATLYGFMVGDAATPLVALIVPEHGVISFLLWSSLMGASLAAIIFTISAFSVPLLYYRRASLIRAVVASVKMVFGNLPVSIVWALCLSTALIASIVLLPLFLVVFPVLAFASHALYRELYGDEDN